MSASPTRYDGLGYRKVDATTWMFVDTSDGGDAQIGPQYRSKAELLSDIESFAKIRGYDDRPDLATQQMHDDDAAVKKAEAEVLRTALLYGAVSSHHVAVYDIHAAAAAYLKAKKKARLETKV